MLKNKGHLRGRSLQRGQSLILVMFGIVVFAGFCALVIDIGRQGMFHQKLRNYSDGAAFAGAQLVPDNPNTCAAVQEAVRIYSRNLSVGGAVVPISPPLSSGTCPAAPVITTDPADPANTQMRTYTFTVGDDTVKVTTPYTSPVVRAQGVNPSIVIRVQGCRTVGNHFGQLLGFPANRNCAFAVAKKGAPFTLQTIALSENANPAIWVQGNSQLRITNGSIQINSTGSGALDVGGGAIVTAQSIGITGGFVQGQNATISPPPSTGVPPVADPYAMLPAPSIVGLPVFTGGRIRTSTVSPGVWVGGMQFQSGTFTMEPGIYIMLGGGFQAGAQATITGNEVMVYNTFDSSNPGDAIDIGAGADLTMSPPTSGTYEDILFFQDRLLTIGAELSGGGNFNTTGIFYLPEANMQLGGHGALGNIQFIVDTLTIRGGANLSVTLPDPSSSGEPVQSALLE